MFPLPTNEFPASAGALREAIEGSLRRIIRPENVFVTVEDRHYPQLALLRISLDQAVARKPISMLRPSRPDGKVSDALEVDEFELRGQPLLVEGSRLHLQLKARGVRIGRGTDGDGKLLLLLQEVAEGTAEVSISLRDLEALLLVIAEEELARAAVHLEELRVDLRSRGPRSIDLAVHARGRKLFLTASLRVSGSLEIDDDFEGRIFNLKCTGEGPLGILACGAIGPRIEGLEGAKFPLMALPIGTTKIREIEIAADDGLRVSARFGGANGEAGS